MKTEQTRRDAALLMAIVAQSERSARAKRTRSQKAVFDRIEARIAARAKRKKPTRPRA